MKATSLRARSAFLSTLLGLAVATFCLVLLSGTEAWAQQSDPTVFINEIHYDDEGDDADEGVEIAGPAGTDLLGYSIVLYNGSSGTSYNTDELTGVISDKQDGFGTINFAYPANGIQNGSPDGIALIDASDNVVQFLSYEGAFAATDGPASGMISTDIEVAEDGQEADGTSLQLQGSGDVYGDFTWEGPNTQTSGEVNVDQTFTTEDVPPSDTTRISDIQGPGRSSSRVGDTVNIEGVVTGIDDEIGANYERTLPEEAGIYVQEETADQDNDPNSSEGIFVGYVRDRQAYPLGSIVRVEGKVKEKFGFTMISETKDQEPQIVGNASVPEPVIIDLARAAAQNTENRRYYESLESMRVRLATGTASSGGTNKFGELFLTPGAKRDRVFATENVPALIGTADDAGAGDPDNPYRDPDGSTTVVKADLFDRVDDVVGPLAYLFGNYKVMVQQDRLPVVKKGPTRYPYKELAAAGRSETRVASFNVFNYLPTGAELDLGTVTPEEEAEKRSWIADAIGRLLKRPDVVALQEVGTKEQIDALAAQLGGYTGYLEEGNDERGIDVAFLVKDTVTASNPRQIGRDAQGPAGYDCSDDEGGLFDRPPLLIDITTTGGRAFTLVNNHFASKGAPDTCRQAQAEYVRDEVTKIEASGGQAIVLGDLNSFEDEVALDVLQDGKTTLTNQWGKAPGQERYSYQFSGRLQTLDHVLITDGLDPLYKNFRYAHIDTDYYDRDQPLDGHKVSDHDPAVLTLDGRKSKRGGGRR